MRWSNAFIRKIERDENGKVVRLEGEYNPKSDFRATKHKLSWVCKTDKLQTVKLIEYDYLLTKKMLDENDDFLDYLTSKDHPTKAIVCCSAL